VLTQGRFLAARPFFERAIALDPNFAAAYYYLSLSFNNAGDTSQEATNKSKAFALIDRVSEFEREQISGGYFESTANWIKPSIYIAGHGQLPPLVGLPQRRQ